MGMSKRAWFYIILIMGLGISILLFSYIRFRQLEIITAPTWPQFILLAALMTAAQLFKTEATHKQLYHPNLMFAFAALLLLPAFLFCLVIIISHLVEWVKERLVQGQVLRNWYVQPFNMGMHITLGFSSWTLISQVLLGTPDLASPLGFIGAVMAAIIYAGLNHLMVGLVLALARGISWKESGILDLENLSTDFVMLTMGYPLAVLINLSIWIFLPALTPLYLIYRALSVPALRKQAATDPKTGLWNAEYFRKMLMAEINRATRHLHPLTVIVADIDHLRNINNAFGHLAGDEVLKGVASLLRTSFREYDLVARFGGEEFSILMPETEPSEAFDRIERVRKIIAEQKFTAPISNAQFAVTMSFGLAELEPNDELPEQIIHRADIAVYTAKVKGRNLTCIYSPEAAHSLGLVEVGE